MRTNIVKHYYYFGRSTLYLDSMICLCYQPETVPYEYTNALDIDDLDPTFEGSGQVIQVSYLARDTAAFIVELLLMLDFKKCTCT